MTCASSASTRAKKKQALLRLNSLKECQLWEEQGKYNKDFTKGNGRQHVSGHFREPVGTFTGVVFAYSKIAQQKGLRFVHRGNCLSRHAQLEQV